VKLGDLKSIKNTAALLGLVAISALTVLSLTSISRERLKATELARESLVENQIKLTSALEKLRSAVGRTSIDFSSISWNTDDPDAELQRKLVAAAKISGVELLSFGPGIPQIDTSGMIFANELEVQTTNLKFLGLLRELEEISPPISISSLGIRQGAGFSAETGETLISVRMTVWVINQRDVSDENPSN
jgi:hypothetical protein